MRGRRLLDKRCDARANHDMIRCLLIREPRGHAEMCRAVSVEPDDPEADLAVRLLQGEANYTGKGRFTRESDGPLAEGLLLW